MPNKHFTIGLRDRLLLPVCQEGARCQHRRPNGAVCNALLDARGQHQKKCAIRGGLGPASQYPPGLCLRELGRCSEAQALKKQRVPDWDREGVDDQGQTVTELAVLDVASSDPASGWALYLDSTVTTACTSSNDPAALCRRARGDGRGAGQRRL